MPPREPEDRSDDPVEAPPDDVEELEAEEEADDPEAPPAEEEEKLLFPDGPIASEKELREALDWAFEGEEDADEALLDTFARHARMVLEGTRRMNLTKIIDPREVAAKHYLDSWRSTRYLALMGRSLADVGSGAGFPGIPIALSQPHTRVVLIESRKKKADFVAECLQALGIGNASIVNARAEEHLARNHFDVVVMRAISSVRENVRLLRKVRHSHQDLVMLKGPSWSREVRAGEREVERLGFRLDTVWEHELPGGLGGRAVLLYRAPGGQGR